MIRALAVAALTLALGGCALLSSPDPVQLYRFGDMSPGDGATTQATPVTLTRVQFPAAAAGDRVLTTDGVTAAYLAGARWVTPAEQLFQDALGAAFLRDARATRLVERRELARSATGLDVEVLSFEARYPVAGAAPTVVLQARARLVAFPERTVSAERTFRIEHPAAENRVSAIVAAYDAAVADFNGQLVQWVDANAG